MIGIDDKSAAHLHSSGIINPVTGRRIVKSWNIDTLLPIAVATYKYLEKNSGQKLIYSRDIIRIFDSAGEQNDFLARTAEDPYLPYLKMPDPDHPISIEHTYGIGLISNSFQVDMAWLVRTLRHQFLVRREYKEEAFLYEDLIFKRSNFQYNSYSCQRIIFAEGYRQSENPWLSWLPIIPNKGEYFTLVDTPYDPAFMYKKNLLLTRWHNGQWWLGATHHPGSASAELSLSGRQELTKRLGEFGLDDSLATMKAGIRATTQDRMPILGWHPQYPRLGIFNGFGAKGASLIPWCAKIWAENMVRDHQIPPEIDLRRFISRFYPSAAI